MPPNDELPRCVASGTHREQYWIECLASRKWVRALFAGTFVADSSRTLLVRESGRRPVYYFPEEDIKIQMLRDSGHRAHDPAKGTATFWSIEINDSVAVNAAWSYRHADAKLPELAGYIAFAWDKLDGWFEENEEIFVHARDPYVRVDVLQSARHVRVDVDGTIVADTRQPVLLFETGLPVRYYIPKIDVRTDLLTDSTRVTRCPYKGEAKYYSLQVGGKQLTDVAWYYRYPTSEASAIANHLCFYQERLPGFGVEPGGPA